MQLPAADRRHSRHAVEAILAGYRRGTRYGIRPTDDGLLAAGEPGVQLTWMDAKVGDWVVTPRIGKPVEIQALWLNALRIAAGVHRGWREHARARRRGRSTSASGTTRRGCLYDVVDVDHRRAPADATLRPNQIFAVGGLPFAVLDGTASGKRRGRSGARLWTPLGLPDAAPDDGRYVPRYEGDVRSRDGAYHQGTVWPWLLGPFVEAWVRVRGNTDETARGPAPVPRSAAPPPDSGRAGAHLRDRGRRAAAHPARVSLPGLVGG